MKTAFMGFVLGVFMIGVGCSTSAADKPAHASLAAYPNAVVEAKDAASGTTVTVEPNGREIKAVDKGGKVLWKVDLIQALGKPSTGDPVVRHVAIRGGKVYVLLGKSLSGEVDLKTGKAVLRGED